MSTTYNSAVHVLQGGKTLEVDGAAGGTIDAPAGGTLPIGTVNAATVQIGPQSSPCAAAQTVAGAGTITLPANSSNQLLTTAGAVTGVILTAGTVDGQEITLINTSANSITFAAVGTSNVADGVSAVIAANRSLSLVWSATAAKWYHT